MIVKEMATEISYSADIQQLDIDSSEFVLDILNFSDLVQSDSLEYSDGNSIKLFDNDELIELEISDECDQKSKELEMENKSSFETITHSIASNVSSVDSRGDNSNYSTISISSGPSCKFNEQLFFKMLMASFNNGDINSLRYVIQSHALNDCTFRVKKPTYSERESGPSSIADFYEQILSISPDAILSIRGFKRRQLTDSYILRCKVNSSGTLINYLAYKARLRKVCSNHACLADMMDSTKNSKANIDAVRAAELIIRSQNRLIQTFMKGVLYLYVSELDQKISVYDLTMSLTSIKAFDI